MFFKKKDRSAEAVPFISKIIELSTPQQPYGKDGRLYRRYNRSLPVIIFPWDDEQVSDISGDIGITSDISDQGIGLITQCEIAHSAVVVAFFLHEGMGEPWYFLATVRNPKPSVGYLYQYGLEVIEFLNEQKASKVRQLDALVLSVLGHEAFA